MCGRYALHLRPSEVRQRLADQDMPADDAPDDEQTRQTYNFAPGNHGLIYRADTADHGAGDASHGTDSSAAGEPEDGEPQRKRTKLSHATSPSQAAGDHSATRSTKYKLQSAQWGLIPFWTKRAPDYASKMKTINCRDDSLIENRGMWNTMKQRKRCIVVAEGFYEWQKKSGAKIPHYTKRRDGALMCLAGLWDMVQYEGSEDKHYTYTVITTSSNKQLSFLHDRMPVILEPGSAKMKAWLDPDRVGWDTELQNMLKPFEGELECYPVDRGVGKVGNNSPLFVVPVDSKENKNNIANFFGKQRETAGEVAAKNQEAAAAGKADGAKLEDGGVKQENDGPDDRVTSKVEDPESNAPLPKPQNEADEKLSQVIKEEESPTSNHLLKTQPVDPPATELEIKRETAAIDDATLQKAAETPAASKKPSPSPAKSNQTGGRKTRSATTNNTIAKTPTKGGNARITSFFGK
ncbi:hypothetical protein LTR08_007672 [Meristemomyces frigidus]|nr:hypothetical protein LTR08_007672 [Meristemomyces frigidus]